MERCLIHPDRLCTMCGECDMCEYEHKRCVYETVIDQHAAHERLNYDRYLAQMERQQVIRQPLLAPCVVTMAVEEVQLVLDHKDIFLSMGFDLDTFGLGAIAIRAVPSVFSGLDLHLSLIHM